MQATQIMEKVKNLGLKPAYHGVLLSTELIAIFNQFDNVKFFGTEIPSFFPLAVSGLVSSLTTELLHEFIFDLIPSDEKMKTAITALSGMGLAGLSGTLALKIMSDVPNQELAMTALTIALAYGANELIYNEIINKMTKM